MFSGGAHCLKLPDAASNYSAELFGIVEALNIISEQNNRNFTIFTDCKRATKALTHYNSTNPIIRTILSRFITSYTETPKAIRLCWCPGHVVIPGNERADTEANAIASSHQEPHLTSVPFKDFYPLIKTKMKEWNINWEQIAANKLRIIRDNINPTNPPTVETEDSQSFSPDSASATANLATNTLWNADPNVKLHKILTNEHNSYNITPCS